MSVCPSNWGQDPFKYHLIRETSGPQYRNPNISLCPGDQAGIYKGNPWPKDGKKKILVPQNFLGNALFSTGNLRTSCPPTAPVGEGLELLRGWERVNPLLRAWICCSVTHLPISCSLLPMSHQNKFFSTIDPSKKGEAQGRVSK